MKHFLVLLTAVIIAFCTISVNAAAFSARDNEGLPAPTETCVLKQAEWNGKKQLKANTCYFVNKAVKVTANNTLPKSSMIVVENSGSLTVAKNTKLYISGDVVVHSKAKLTSYGELVLKSTSVCVVNGKLAVPASGKVSIYGDVQISRNGIMNIKGRVKTLNNGEALNYGIINKKSASALIPDTTALTDSRELYLAEEYSDYIASDIIIYSWYDEIGANITDASEKLKLIRSFESILYKFDGDFSSIDCWSLNPSFDMYMYPNSGSKNHAYARMTTNGWLSFAAENSDDPELVDSWFYIAIKGKGNAELFAKVDPNSPLYIHAE